MRIIKKLALFSLASLITFGLGMAVHRLGSAAVRYFSEPSAWQVLLSFENQDLEGLDEQSLRVVQHAIDITTGQLDHDQPLRFAPRVFRRISNTNGERRYILAEGSGLWSIPGAETVRVHIFDTAGKILSSTQFDTGNRMAIIGMRIKKGYDLDSEALIINCEGVFGGNSSYQVYGIVGNELRLAYIGAGIGVDTNYYYEPWMTIGPRLNLSADEWERELQSTDNVRVLSALTWLAGYHWDGQEPPYDKDRSDGEKVRDLRARESVRRRLADFTHSSNYFIKATAEAILKNK